MFKRFFFGEKNLRDDQSNRLDRAPERKRARGEADDASSGRTAPLGDHIYDVAVEALVGRRFKFVAVDAETANTHVGSICQLGLACVADDNRISVLTMLIDPETRFDDRNIAIHGIGPDDVAGQPTFDAVFEILKPFLEQHDLIQHSSFDSRAIRAACQDANVPEPVLRWHDSVAIARRAWPELKGNGGHGLASLKTHLGLEFEHHDAGEDARAAAEVVLLAEAHTSQDFKTLLAKRKPSPKVPSAVTMDGVPAGPLFGQVAVFTGSLSISRVQAATLAARVGIATKSSISRKVTLLVVGDQDLGLLVAGQTKSSKHRKAEELILSGHDLRIMGESEFLDLVRGN